MFQLARQLPSPVIVTATSHLGTWQLRLADQHIVAATPDPIEALEHGLKGVILITGEIAGDRTEPMDDHMMDWLHQYCSYHSIPLLIEADGSRSRPLKGWAVHEPPIPAFVDLVVQVVGLAGLGKLLDDENVHRPEIFSRLSGLSPGQPMTPEAVVQVLRHGESGLKNIPANARRVALLNQADTQGSQSAAHGMSRALLDTYDAVIIASLAQEEIFAVHERIAGVILAAGESRRFGQPKQLLDWKGQPFVRAVARTALEAGLSPVVVVTGANAEQVQQAVQGLSVIIIKNEEWMEGQGSSIRAGVKALRLNTTRPTGGAIFLLTDQPQVTTSILRALVEKHAEGLYPAILPMVIDRRANPVLFDRSTFADLMALEGDVGGRAIFHKYDVEYLPWHDDRLLLDVDTPEMYRRLISDESL